MENLKKHPEHENFYLHIITDNYSIYCNTLESDDSANTIVYNTEKKLVSNNYFANQLLYEILTGQEEENIIFISEEMKNNQIEMLKQLDL